MSSAIRAAPLAFVAFVACHATPPPGAPARSRLRSAYTATSRPHCTLIESDDEGSSSTLACPGLAGWSLELFDSDARMSAAVVTPGRKEFPLDIASTITRSFSAIVGPAHWRVADVAPASRPIALLLRIDANEDPLQPDAVTSYLAVVKLSSEAACIVARFRVGIDSEASAIDAADHASPRACLPPLPSH